MDFLLLFLELKKVFFFSETILDFLNTGKKNGSGVHLASNDNSLLGLLVLEREDEPPVEVSFTGQRPVKRKVSFLKHNVTRLGRNRQGG